MYLRKEDREYITYTGNITRSTEKGFQIIDIPAPVYEMLSSWYDRSLMKPETYESKDFYIKEDCFIQDINAHPNMVKFIKENMHEVHEVWVGRPIKPAVVYGIRSYSNGSTLKDHHDRQDTHHVATSITMGKDAPWSLNIQDHDKQWWAVDVEPGQGIMFESGVCIHGRLDRFEGTYFDNIYTHYTFLDPFTPYEG